MHSCEQILKRICDLEAQLKKREAQLAEDRYDLFHRAYAFNPGGDLANKGTYVGHVRMLKGLEHGIKRLQMLAKDKGCL